MSEAQRSLFQIPAGDVNVGSLELLMEGHAEWMTAAQILVKWGLPAIEWRKRYVRALAERSAWVISGQRGYKHLKHATAEELNHAAHWLESQAKKMGDRAAAYRRHAHQVLG